MRDPMPTRKKRRINNDPVSAGRLRDARHATPMYYDGVPVTMTQQDLASLIEVDINTIRNWERTGLPQAEVMRWLSEVTGRSLDELFGVT